MPGSTMSLRTVLGTHSLTVDYLEISLSRFSDLLEEPSACECRSDHLRRSGFSNDLAKLYNGNRLQVRMNVSEKYLIIYNYIYIYI